MPNDPDDHNHNSQFNSPELPPHIRVISQSSQDQNTSTRYLYNGTYFADTQIIQDPTQAIGSARGDVLTASAKQMQEDEDIQDQDQDQNNNNILSQQSITRDTNPLQFGSQISQSVLGKVKLLAQDDDNLIMDSSCERDTQDIEFTQPLNVSLEPKNDTTAETQSQSPFKSLKIGGASNREETQTPWMNKIKNPFDETPNAKTPSSFSQYYQDNMIDTPSVINKADVFQKIRDENERKGDIELQQSLPMNISFGDQTLDNDEEDDQSPLKLMNRLTETPSSASSRLPNLLSQRDPIRRSEASQLTPSKPERPSLEHSLNSCNEPTVIDIYTDDEDEVVIPEETTQQLPPSLVSDGSSANLQAGGSTGHSETQQDHEVFTLPDNTPQSQQQQGLSQRPLNDQLPSPPHPHQYTRHHTLVPPHTTSAQVASSPDNIPGAVSQAENYPLVLSQSQSVQVPGTNPDHYSQSDVLTSPLKKKDDVNEVCSDDDEDDGDAGKDVQAELDLAEDSLRIHRRVIKEKEKAEAEALDLDAGPETIPDEIFTEKVKRLTSVRLSSLKSKSSQRETMDPRTLEEQLGLTMDMTQEVSEVEDVTDENKSGDDQDDHESEGGDGFVHAQDLKNLLTESEANELEDLEADFKSNGDIRENEDEHDEEEVINIRSEDTTNMDDESKIDNTIAEETTDQLASAATRPKRNRRQIAYDETTDDERDLEIELEKEAPPAKRNSKRQQQQQQQQQHQALSSPVKPPLLTIRQSSSPHEPKPHTVQLPTEVLTEEPRLTLTEQDVLIPSAVWCLFDVSYFPGILLKRLINNKYQIQFETSVDLMTTVEPLDLRIDDVVSFKGDEYLVRGLYVENPDLQDANVIRCMRGYDTVLAERKKKKKPVRGKSKAKPKLNGNDSDQISLPISALRLSNEEWFKVNRVVRNIAGLKRVNTVLEENPSSPFVAHQPARTTTDAAGVVTAATASAAAAASANTTIVTGNLTREMTMEIGQDEMQVSSTPIINKSNSLHAELIRLSNANSDRSPHELFKDCLFFVTGSESLKRSVKTEIITHGGTLLDSNLTEVFLNYIMVSSNSTSRLKAEPVETISEIPFFLLDFLSQFKHTALLTEKHSRTPKYIEFLSLGWPVLSTRFIADCIHSRKFLSWQMSKYLLPSGSSQLFGDVLKSQDCFQYFKNCQDGFLLDQQLSNNTIISNSNENENDIETYIIIVASHGDKNIKISKFIWWTITSKKANIRIVSNKNQLIPCLESLSEQSKKHRAVNLYVYSEKEDTVKGLHRELSSYKQTGNTTVKGRKKQTRKTPKAVDNRSKIGNLNLKFIDWEWLLQCVITGLVIPVDLEL
ncbi:hypothetical protein WICPIJ_006692 [Wickerhamomyces pijperi]|uniref:BRCT domain-containing protein n=1 Tax=Wickerhamomyces pijperi TaxID=599730 RepID=A0A9P8Q378_WICPI|nr:hypothetical protein WICPIJ_006692 [Wickerhamomyces pijperi]